MLENSKLSQAVKLALFASAVSFTTTNAVAADAAGADVVEKIEVTGSRILREGAISPSPVTVISGEQLLNSGVINIGEALNELPALAATYSLSNSGRFIGTAGLSILDLRGMGTDRTLVLVDGKRHVSSSGGTASVDTNTIPSEWVDRVEVITGGASAVYGADAVTGVVNFILKKNIEGLSVKATAGYADNSDYKNDKFALSYGTNFDNDRGNIAFSLEYASQDSLNALDNPFTDYAFRNITNFDQPADMADSVDHPDVILRENAGLFILNNAGVWGIPGNPYGYSFNPDGSARQQYIGTEGVNATSSSCFDCDYINLRQFMEVQPEFDRYNANLKFNYDVTEDMNAYFSAKFVRTESKNIGQPAFMHGGRAAQVTRDNPYLDQSVIDIMDENELESISINRFMDDMGRRIEDDERDVQRYVLGLEGVIFDEWDFDLSLVYGQTDLERVNSNNLILDNYHYAVDAIEDDNGDIVCRDETARANGCVPVNIMGYGQPSDEAIDYINTVSVGNVRIKQTVVTGSVTNGDFYELPAGSIGVALGMEYRKEESETFEPDNAEGTFFNVLGEDKGDYDVTEIFGEVSVPVLADLPGVESMVVEAAVRYADYSTIGNATSWKLGLDWEISDELRMRSTYSEAIRAPNIGELFGALSENFYSIDDVCRSSELDKLADSSVRRANCAALGVPADFDSTYDDARVPGESGGNRELKEEKSTSVTIGLVYQPDYISGLSMTVDYWKIELEDAISEIDEQDIVNNCVDSTSGIDNEYCALLTRGENHEITNLQQFALNISGQDAAGVDFELGYDFDALGGSFTTTLIGTRLLERKEYPYQDDPANYKEHAGTEAEAKWQGNLSLGYKADAWSASWSTRYFEHVNRYDNTELALNPNPSSNMHQPSYVISDMTVGYDFDNGLKLTLGVDNVFNKALPYGASGTDEYTGIYDVIGRFGYLTLNYKM